VARWPFFKIRFTAAGRDESTKADREKEESEQRDAALRRLTLIHGSKKIDAKKYPLPLSRPAFIFQNFVQRAGQLSGTAIELARQQVVFLFQDVIFVGDIQRGQHGQA
jgi:hypothetical protein